MREYPYKEESLKALRTLARTRGVIWTSIGLSFIAFILVLPSITATTSSDAIFFIWLARVLLTCIGLSMIGISYEGLSDPESVALESYWKLLGGKSE